MTESETTPFTLEQLERIDAMITNRLVTFHDAMVERGQIGQIIPEPVYSNDPPKPKLEVVKNDN